jgi:hypothetical protein
MRAVPLEDAVGSFEKQSSPQWPLSGHSLLHPVSGEVAPEQVEVQRSDIVFGDGQYCPCVACQHFRR